MVQGHFMLKTVCLVRCGCVFEGNVPACAKTVRVEDGKIENGYALKHDLALY